MMNRTEKGRHALRRAGLTAGQAQAMSDAELLRQPGVGRVALSLIRELPVDTAVLLPLPPVPVPVPPQSREQLKGKRITVELGNEDARMILRKAVGAPIRASLSVSKDTGITTISWTESAYA